MTADTSGEHNHAASATVDADGAHTHAFSGTTSTPNDTLEVEAGAGALVAADSHQHISGDTTGLNGAHTLTANVTVEASS